MSDKDSEYFTVVFMGDLKALEGNPFWYRSDFGTPISIATGHALETLDDMRDVAQGAVMAWPSREVIAREIRRAMLDNPTDDSFNKRAEKREAIANDAADAILARFAATLPQVTEGERAPAIEFNEDAINIARLRRLLQWCRPRMKNEAYQLYLDKCLADPSRLDPDPEMQGKLVQSSPVSSTERS